jgi:hypothetical protein
MSPVSFDTSSGVQGAEASTTVGGIAIALIVGIYWTGLLLVIGGVGAVVAAVIYFSKLRGPWVLLARLGLGLVVGTALYFGLVAIGVLPPAGT